MVEYYCMLVDNIRLICWLCLIIFGSVMISTLVVAWEYEWDGISDSVKMVLAIMAGVISLSILILLFLPTSDVLRAMMSE